METGSTAVFTDRLLKCIDCGSDFVFTAGEQLFFSGKNFKNDPKRCKPCKLRRSGAPMNAGAGLAAAGISRIETRTKCSACGLETTVPFRPTQGRPVLCRECFQTKPELKSAAKSAAVTRALAAFADPAVAALAQASSDASGAGLTQEAAVAAAASMSAAPPRSSVATAADLASISEAVAGGVTPTVPVGSIHPAAELPSLKTTQA